MPSIKILNKTYEMKCPAGEEADLEAAANRLNQELTHIRSRFKNLDDVQSMMLAAMNLSHQLNQTEAEQEQQRNKMSRFIQSLEQKVNQAVTSKNDPE